MVKRREPVQRIWRKTDVEVTELTLNGISDTYMRVWLHTLDVWATPGQDHPNTDSKCPPYTCTIEGVESFAKQLLDVVEKAEAFKAERTRQALSWSRAGRDAVSS
jgi:hypothetical protein